MFVPDRCTPARYTGTAPPGWDPLRTRQAHLLTACERRAAGFSSSSSTRRPNPWLRPMAQCSRARRTSRDRDGSFWGCIGGRLATSQVAADTLPRPYERARRRADGALRTPLGSAVKILHVNKFLYRRGGAEAYLFDLAEMQRRQGHVGRFFAMAHPENERSELESLFPSHVEFAPPPASALGKIKAVGRMLYSPSARQGMEAALASVQPDVVHLHNIYHQLSPSVLRPLQGIPAVMTLHDYKLACPTYLFLDHGRLCEACLG